MEWSSWISGVRVRQHAGGEKKVGGLESARASSGRRARRKVLVNQSYFDENLNGMVKTERKSGRTCGEYGHLFRPMPWGYSGKKAEGGA